MRTGLVLVSLCLSIPAPLAAQPAAWKAGAAKAVITPDQPMWMSGYGSRDKPAEGKLHDLWAKALALEDAKGNRAVLVTLDLVGIGRDLSVEICKALQDRHKLPREAIVLSTSHTHCGPVVGDNLRAMYFLDHKHEQLVADYSVKLKRVIAQVAAQAFERLEPAELTWGIGKATFAVNRRNNKEAEVPTLKEKGLLEGPVDHDVPVLAVRGAMGELKAVAFGYACHATVLSFYQWCGDYPGFAQLELEKAHPGAIALFWAGCGADQNPLPRRTVALAENYGKQLATGVEDALRSPMQKVAGGWAGVYREIPLPLHDLPSRDKLVQATESQNKFEASRARRLLKELEAKGSLRGEYPYPVQTWRLGELTWVALGGEVVVDYALRLKRELTPGKAWIMGYANDVMAYIPSLRVLKEGGYEGGGAMVYYGLPSVWGPRVEELIVEEVRSQVR